MRALAFVLAALVVAAALLVSTSAGSSKVRPTWAYLVYLDADNSLDVSAGAHHEPVVQSDLDELMSVGSTSDVVVYVLVDRVAGPANLFRVEKGRLVELTNFALDGKEANMGDPATLRSFVTYTSKASSADHTLLVFWDHGSPRYAAWDDHPADALTHTEVIAALSGFHVDVVAADECLVGQLEVAYEYVTQGAQVDYLVAAETYTGWRGFPYDWTLRDLVAKPTMSAREVAVMMVEETDALLSQNPYMGEEVNSHAAIDMSKVQALAASMIDLGNLLASDMKAYAGLVSKARGAAVFSYGANPMNLVDLKTFVERISSGTSSKALKESCAVVIARFDVTVVALQVTQTLDHQIYGLGLMLPNHSRETPGYYWTYAFMADGWRPFLEAYWSAAGST